MRATALILLSLLTLFAQAQNYYGQNYAANDAILLDQVRVLTFQSGAMTTGRRSSPLPQLHCVGGSAQSNTKLYPHSVQCVNMGSDTYGNIQWKCEADLDSSVRFGNNVVSCEGYSHPDDPYVLKGSCGLEYTLEYTEQGRASQGYNGYNFNGYSHQSSGFSWGNVFMLVIIGLIVFGLLRQCTQNAANGGGYTRTDTYTGYPPAYPGCEPSTAYATGAGTGFRPGFWSGVGTGGLLGYLFRPRTYYGNGYGGGYYGGGYYGGGARGYGGSSWGGGGVGSSSSPRTATGFATTKRR